jgi:drug/metabolite transporter (DMT)-like permease
VSAHLGEFAALATSFLFSASSTLFTFAGRKVGPATLNRFRLLLASLWLVLAHWWLRIPLPFDASPKRYFWLAISGVVGLVIGDTLLFQAFVIIGPRLSMLLMALSPAIAALFAWPILGETLSLGQITGIALALGGIAWVISERNEQINQSQVDRGNYLVGILCGVGAACGQAIGLITAKQGAGSDFPALSGTLIRIVAAAFTLWFYTFLRKQAREAIVKIGEQPRAAWLILGGSFMGPFLGVTFSLLAIQNVEVGIASTLMSLSPIILLPVGYIIFKERIGWQAILGTILAMIGVTLLFLI